MYHEPVLLAECIEGLNIQPDGTYVDVTFGGGGHSKGILEKLKNGRLIGFDQDEDAQANKISDKRFLFIPQNFRHLKNMLRVNGIEKVDGILADLGISSFQIDTAGRGFSHRSDSLLDMRMDQHAELTAGRVINNYDEKSLQKLFGEYGEVRNSKTLAAHIVASREKNKIETTEELIGVISPLIRGNRNRYLSQVFQALRIEVNGELNALQEMLMQSAAVLKEGGRLVVVSYHSLEDRIVKNFIRTGNAEGKEEKDFFGKGKKIFKAIHKKPLAPSEEEIARNPRSRSARLRIAERISQ